MSREIKDSGIEWIGQIPKEWRIGRIKTIFQERTELSEDGSETLLSVSEYYGVANRKEKIDDGEYVTRAESLVGYKKCYAGDLVSNIMLAWKGSLGVTDIDGIVSPAYCVYKPTESICPRYYHYLFRTSLFTSIFRLYSKGIIDSRLRLYSPYFFAISTIIPSLSEQQKIADYLDKVCGEVDEMVALQETMIEELKAYKQSVITEAVTKGLEPNVPMKDSGIDWIGKIPEHWEIITLQSLSKSIRNGYVGPTRNLFKDEGIRYIQSLHLKDGIIDFDRHHYFVSEDWANQHPKIHKDDLLIVQTGDIGQVAVVSQEYDGCNCHALIIVVLNINLCLPMFISYYLRSSVGRELLLRCKTGALLPHLNSGRIGVTPITLPSKYEQQSIASYLDTKCSEIDSLIAIKQQKIEELKEYKKSIIYEYVTGKKEVL